MKFIHYCSGITIALFMGFHLLNHLLILHSEALHIKFMQRARKVYRNPIAESILLFAVLVQVVTGISLVLSKWSKMEDFFDRVQVISGLYLSFFLLVHISAVLYGRYRLRFDTNLYFGAGVMNMWPHKLFFMPYYSLAILAFFSHIAAIHKIKMEEFVSSSSAETQAFIIMIIGGLTMLAIITRMANLKTMPSAKTGNKSE